MTNRKIIGVVLAVLVAVALSWADNGNGKSKGKGSDRGEEGEREGQTLSEAQIVRVADLGAGQLGPFFGTGGTDQLHEGSVAVLADRRVEINLEGAVGNTTYNVVFCRFGFPPPCLSSTPGTVATNAAGDVNTRVTFPDTQLKWAGVFVLTRGGLNQFVTGVSFSAAGPSAESVTLELKGKISSLNPGNQSFRIGVIPIDIMVTSATRMSGFDQFSDLAVGRTVEVRGFTAAGVIQATRVELERNN